MPNNPAIWFEIYVQDMKRARKFYETVLDRKLEKLNTPGLDYWAFPMDKDSVGVSGALVKMDGACSGGNSTLVYFACKDCAVEAKRVVAAGGKLHKEKFSIGEYGNIALAFDTEENMFGLHSMS
jgi:predicted enzyme related to lactoylglutathione lyase